MTVYGTTEARSAGLRWVSDAEPGIARRRRGRGRGFTYLDASEHTVTDAETLARIRAIVIPPAWRQVWICGDADGHIQATGRDERERKQYRYHTAWRTTRDTSKFSRMAAFGAALPRIRAHVARDLKERTLSRENVLATVVRLLDLTALRVGNEEYSRTNDSHGLTTLRDEHAEIVGAKITFEFRAKSGKQRRVQVDDKRLARIVRACRELPGYELFQYLDAEGERHAINSQDVNAYLRTIAEADFTAKDFRTWAGTVRAASVLRSIGEATTKTATTQNVLRALEEVAAVLGNTVAVYRTSYVHPAVIDAYVSGKPSLTRSRARIRGLSVEERETLAFLQQLPEPRRRRAA